MSAELTFISNALGLTPAAPGTVAPNLVLKNLLVESFADTITANATGTQASATALTAELNRITVAANASAPWSSVSLPASAAGLTIIVTNHGANPIGVFGAGTDTIDDIATATGVVQMQGSMCIYSCTTAGSWYSEGLGGGYSGSLATLSFTDAISAVNPGAQGTATALTTSLNRVTTVAAAASGVKLPLAAGGLQITVINAHATNAINVYPFLGDQVNALGANVAFSIAATKTATFTSTVALQWHTVLSA